MISMSDIEEPTCPRSPPSSVRTTSLRRYFDRSSSGGVASLTLCRASALVAIELVLHFTGTRPPGIRRRAQVAVAFASLQLPFSPASTRRCQRSGMNSLSKIRTHRNANSGR